MVPGLAEHDIRAAELRRLDLLAAVARDRTLPRPPTVLPPSFSLARLRRAVSHLALPGYLRFSRSVARVPFLHPRPSPHVPPEAL